MKWRGVDLKKPTTWIIAGFIVLLLWAACHETAEGAETFVRVAPESMFVAGHKYNGSAISIVERFKGKYDIGLGLYTELQCRDQDDCPRGNGSTNIGIHAKRVFQVNWFEIGFGAAYWKNQGPAWDSNLTFALHIGFHFPDRWWKFMPDQILWEHASTGGSSDKNGGLDYPSLGWSITFR